MQINCYFHGGSGNHGCEAIIRSTAKIIGSRANVFSFNVKEDYLYHIDEVMQLFKIGKIEKWYPSRIYFYIMKKITHSNEKFIRYKYRELFDHGSNIALSIGGDNYCYEKGTILELIAINYELNKRNIKTVLWSCSVEPSLLEDHEIIEDLKRYSFISARESITYNALINAGVKNISLIPDVAFILDKTEIELPLAFAKGNTIGINLSPLIISKEKFSGITLGNFNALIQHIIDTTNLQIALIPHVVWDNNDDRKPLKQIYDKFKTSGRVIMVEDHNCQELKCIISHCNMFIGARTHATIAAYSSCVPTLAVGYSIKAKGIARDIFGTSKNYVIPVQSLDQKDELIYSFEWLNSNKQAIRKHLEEFMPEYISRVSKLSVLLADLHIDFAIDEL